MSDIIDIAMDGMNQNYELGKTHALNSLKYPQEIISFIDSCGFDSEQLQRIARAVEDMKGSDYEGNPDDFDRTDNLREQNGEFDML